MISFVGAGPGDSDLITVKGLKLLNAADVIIYAGSLVSKDILSRIKEGAKVFDSAKMTLEEVIEEFTKAEEAGLNTVRLHTGDPSIYGAIKEQIDTLDLLGYKYEVIPGVTSATAACARIAKEFTLPEVSQTFIITRMEGRTKVPETEKLAELAKHKTSMAIYLSASLTEKVQAALLEGYEDPNTPVVIAYKATWADEKIIYTNIANLVKDAKEHNITKHALILVGNFINAHYERSKLYDPSFSTEYRKAHE